MAKLVKLGVLSVAKVHAILMTAMGLIAGIYYAIFGAKLGAFGGAMGIGTIGSGLGIFAIIVLPIVYGILGFVSGAAVAYIYNHIAEKIGGIELEFKM